MRALWYGDSLRGATVLAPRRPAFLLLSAIDGSGDGGGDGREAGRGDVFGN